MNKVFQMERIRKSGHVTSVIALVIEIILIITCVLSAIAVLLALLMPGLSVQLPEILSSAAGGTFIGRIGSFLGAQLGPAAEAAAGGILVVAGVVIEIIIVHRIRKLFASITKGISPFVLETGSTLRPISVLLAVTVLLHSGGILPALVVAVSIWTIALIFDYGCALQRESDEII